MTIKRIKIDLNIINAHFDLKEYVFHDFPYSPYKAKPNITWQGLSMREQHLEWDSTIISCSLSDKCKQLFG